ncbi:hypothetical protein QWJ34_01995 [Saccharibacillus sp. CPCC 101409]|uniref:coiled-coil domain-containing protein n=1 Tax=Saccharibacillus sp. CPCC 101409 TaxID=3058041 RepID=UPI002672D156|nr:hypothetical protein [Saccharibacillus sp. CPCC 101409]MDO3408533.1 hypothetical protein [Saccharibacillus sp. CPCC 101409]
MHTKFARGLRTSLPALLAAGLFLLPNAPRAEAAWNPFDDVVNGIETFGQLPGEVNKLREGYEQTMSELESTKAELSSARSDLEAYRDDLDTYREQNAQLNEQNKQLQATVAALDALREEREKSSRTMKIVIFVLVALFVGFFLFTRVLRFGLRGRR